MVKISLCDEAEIIHLVCGFWPEENQVVMLANENGSFVGYVAASVCGKKAELFKLEDKNGDITLLLVQGCLNVLERRGIEEVFCALAPLESLLLRLGFAPEGNGWKVCLKGYFAPGAHCTHK